MAQLITAVQTYFKDGQYRNSQIVVDIPDEAAKIIKAAWDKMGIQNSMETRYLASNQCGIVNLKDSNEKLMAGMAGIYDNQKVENEFFEHGFIDEDEDED